MELYEHGYKDLMVEGGTYGASGVLIDGGKGYLECIGCVMGSFVGGFLEMEMV